MSALGRKVWREVLRERGQSLAVVSVTALGVMLYASSDGAYRDLRDSYAGTRAKLGLAQLHAEVAGATADDLRALRARPGVGAADARVSVELPAEVRPGQRLALRVLSVPDGAQPALDRLLLVSGRLPAGNEVLVERHLADRHHLAPGDALVLSAPGLRSSFTISGVAVSAEYLWVSRDESDIMPSPDAFGVAWMPRGALRATARALLDHEPGAAARPGLAAAASDGEGNEVLVDPAAPGGDARADLLAVFGPRLLRATAQADLTGVKLLQLDVDGYRGMAVFFPAFFLAVSAFITASVLSRIVDAQRPLVGTLCALGVGRARIMGHYLGYALALGGAGAAVGAVLGTLASRAMTATYAEELGIPFVTARVHWELLASGLGFGVLAAAVAAAVPAWRASRLRPAEAMRPPAPKLGWATRLARGVRAPLPLRMALRAVLGHPLRAVSTAAGVAAALVLVLTTSALMDSMDRLVQSLFQGARRYDLRVDWVAPRPEGDAARALGGLRDVQGTQGVLALPVKLSAGGRTGEALLQGLPPGGALLRSVDSDGREVPPAPGRIVLTRALARRLGVSPGDVVRARLLPSGPEASFAVGGLADGALGATASADLAEVGRAFGLEGQVTSTVVSVAAPALDAARAALARRPEVAHVEDLAQLRGQLGDLMKLGWAMIGAMLLCSVALASAILFNTATLGVLEKRRDLATLRAFGRTMREIASALTLEHAMLAALGLLLGLPLAALAMRSVLRFFSGDLFPLPFVLSPQTVVVAAAGVVAVLLLAQWPALRGVRRTPIAEAVRGREG